MSTSKASSKTAATNPADAAKLAEETPADAAPAAHTAALVTTHAAALAKLAPNPAPLAIYSRVDPDMPEGTIVLGRDPWEHYALIEEGNFIAGEVVSTVKRYETADDGAIEERHLIVLRATRPVTCQVDYKDPNVAPRGTLKKEKVDGVEKTRDVYQIAPGILFATNLRTIMRPLIPMARKAQACEAFIKVGKRVKTKGNAKLSYWEMNLGIKPLNHARDTSLDSLSRDAEEAQSYNAPDVSEVELAVSRPPLLPRNLQKEAKHLLRTGASLESDKTITPERRKRVCALLADAATELLAEDREKREKAEAGKDG